MVEIAYGIAVAGIANAISQLFRHYLKYKAEREHNKIFLQVTKELVEKNREQIIIAVEESFKHQIAHQLESERIARKRITHV